MAIFERQSLSLIWVMLIIAAIIFGFFLGQSQGARLPGIGSSSTAIFQTNPSLTGPLSEFRVEVVTLHGTITRVGTDSLTIQSDQKKSLELKLGPSVAVLTRTASAPTATTSFDLKAIPLNKPSSITLSYTSDNNYLVTAVSYFEPLTTAAPPASTASAKPN